MRVITGQLQSFEGETLTLLTDGRRKTELRIPEASVTRIELSQGRHSVGHGALLGAGKGVLLGVSAGAALGWLDGEDCKPHPTSIYDVCLFSRPTMAKAGALWIGALGLLGGAYLGAALPGERWQEVTSSPKRVRWGVTPIVGRGVGANVAVVF